MKRLLSAVSLALFCAMPASAGPATDALGQCLVGKAAQEDQIKLMRWMFSAMALHPEMSALAAINTDQRATIDKEAAAVFERLLITDCRAEAIAALKADGPTAMAQGFQTLGQIASIGLMSAPEVSAGLEGVAANLDQEKLNALQTEAMQ